MARTLAVDFGLERTGLAISDPEGKLAFPFGTLKLKDYGSRKALLDETARRAAEAKAEAVVVGLPLQMDGSETLASRQARNVAGRLARRINAPFYLMEETLSTVEALEDLRQAGVKADRIEDAVDQQAACRILTSFLALPPSRRQKL